MRRLFPVRIKLQEASAPGRQSLQCDRTEEIRPYPRACPEPPTVFAEAIFPQKKEISCSDRSSWKQNRVFKSIFSRRANGGRREISGFVVPFSHLLTAGIDTFRYCATCSCVSPSSFRLSCMTRFIGMIHSSFRRNRLKSAVILIVSPDNVSCN